MKPLGKVVTAGIALVAGTSLLTGVTTAYMLRPAAPAEPDISTYATLPARRAPVVAAARIVPAVNRTTPSTPRPIPVASSASECDTGSDRAWRIAKPGAIGALLGAGLGAAGGAIADGGSGAGKGALIGGLLGTATGAGYGAYKTKNECGTILANPGVTAAEAVRSDRRAGTEAPLRPRASDDITIYPAR
jgi:hypothetical protein